MGKSRDRLSAQLRLQIERGREVRAVEYQQGAAPDCTDTKASSSCSSSVMTRDHNASGAKRRAERAGCHR